MDGVADVDDIAGVDGDVAGMFFKVDGVYCYMDGVADIGCYCMWIMVLMLVVM
jgi:hypothetical protein